MHKDLKHEGRFTGVKIGGMLHGNVSIVALVGKNTESRAVYSAVRVSTSYIEKTPDRLESLIHINMPRKCDVLMASVILNSDSQNPIR